MKSRSLKIYLISAGVILVLYIIAQLNRPKAINWAETLDARDKIPFGAWILNNHLRDVFPGANIAVYRAPVYNVIAEDSVQNSSYIIVAPSINLSKTDYDQLSQYIKKGNDVFIAAAYFGTLFFKHFGVATGNAFELNSKKNPVNFLSPTLNPKKYYSIDRGIGSSYFSGFDTAKAVVLGENASHDANFLQFKIGKGSLFLMPNPLFFSNYSLLKPQGRAYAETALSFVKNTHTLLMDSYYTQGNEENDSPMRVFLTRPALEWAYYIALFSLLVFVIFEIKRRQRIIPVIEPLPNATLDFVNIVGQVYYEKRDNADIAKKKIRYFLAYLRDEYQLKTNAISGELAKQLTGKLGLEQDFATELVEYFNRIEHESQVTDKELIYLNYLIEQFNTKTR